MENHHSILCPASAVFSAPASSLYASVSEPPHLHAQDNTVHAKLLVVDRRVAIVSSMNFFAASTAGQSWEAGLVSVDETVVENITDTIMKLKEEAESKEKSGFA
ncbi:MAG: phospholipase D-like domain-containing protein [Candidatus Hermodarchaeia archaeon]